MSGEGTRFSSSNNYQRPYQQQPGIALSPPFSSYYPPNPSAPSQQPIYTPAVATYQVPVVQEDLELLLSHYSPTQRLKIKSDNTQKYSMNSESAIYKMPAIYLENLVHKYPDEFPSQMREDLTKNVGKMRRDYGIFNKCLWGGGLYWMILRKRAWFKLTGNAIMRISWAFICIDNMIDLSSTVNEYLTQNAYIYNRDFQAVIAKHNINLITINRPQMASS